MTPVEVKELLGWLFHKLEITKRDLALLLGVDRSTISEWEKTGYIDFGTCKFLLQLLEADVDRILPLLQERLTTTKDRAPWPDRVRAMRKAFALTLADFADLLSTNPDAIVNWEQGHSAPMSCHAVLLDLIEDHPDEMADLLGFVAAEEVEESPPEWPKDRLLTLMNTVDWKTGDLARYLGIETQSVASWLRGSTTPAACSAFLLRLLEKFPEAAVKLFGKPDLGDWQEGRAAAARERGGVSMSKLSRLTGIAQRTISEWETEMVTKKDCPKILYSALERNPAKLLYLARQLA